MSNQRYCLVCLTETKRNKQGICFQCQRRKATGIPAPKRPPPDAREACGAHGPVCLDHDHITHEFRGWLCRTCNGLAGMHADSAQLLRARIIQMHAIVAYLEKRPKHARPPITGEIVLVEPGIWKFEREGDITALLGSPKGSDRL